MKSLSRPLPAISVVVAAFFCVAHAAKPQSPPAANSQAKPPAKTPMGPPVSQSRHYPILLIAQGADPAWSLRLGMKGPERLERGGYPPIPLEPSDVEQETTGASWIYHAKDSQTSATVAVHVSRETCTDGTSDIKYTFRVSLDHAQIGTLKGCAKVAPEQFPEFKQKNLDDDDPEKQKAAAPTVTNFKPPVAVAYLDATGKVMLAKNDVPKPVVPKGFGLSVAHDGKRVMYLRQENGPETSIQIVDPLTGKSSELIRGLVNYAFWSPDDSHIAFVKSDASVWHIWTMPVTAGAQPSQLSPTPINFLNGWADAHTLVGANSNSFVWITEDGGTSQVLTALDLCGPDFESDSASTVRANPVNPDLLLVSGALLKTPGNSLKDAKTGLGADLFLY